MTPKPPPEHAPVDRDDLVVFFTSAQRPDPSTHLVGTELEKFGFDVRGETPVTVSYDEHIRPVMESLCASHGWEADPDRGSGGEVVALRRDGASITLEPGGQFELSGKPLPNVHATCAEFTQHARELDAVSRPLGLSWVATGFHPWATREEVHWMPKGRYGVMRSYLPTRGAKALDMMLRTCTVQANFDYASEQQAGERLRLALAMASTVTALFANSRYEHGRDTGQATVRSATWFDVDPDRCGLPRFVFDEPFSFERYVDWALDVPMFFVKRDHRYHPHHVPFRRFLADGFTDPDGTEHRATYADWTLHLSTLFPEVRLKPFVEVRSADAVSSRYVCAVPALLKGILYDDDASAQAWSMLSDLSYDDRMTRWRNAVAHGLADPTLRADAARLVTLARDGLLRAGIVDDRGRNEARFLDPLDPLVHGGRSPGDDAAQTLGPNPGREADGRWAFIEAFHFAGVDRKPAS